MTGSSHSLCQKCADLWNEQQILFPGQLSKTIRVFRGNLEDGPWDEVACAFKCTTCGTKFSLSRDTDKGRGSWVVIR